MSEMKNEEMRKMNRRDWLKVAAGMVVAAVAGPLVKGSPSGGDGAARQAAAVPGGGAPVSGRRKAGKIALREMVGCVECDACMPCGYGVDIPGNFRVYNELLAEGMVPDVEREDETSGEFRRKAVGFMRRYDRSVADRHQSQRCVRCFHCVNECRHGVFIVTELAELTALTDALRDWECRVR